LWSPSGHLLATTTQIAFFKAKRPGSNIDGNEAATLERYCGVGDSQMLRFMMIAAMAVSLASCATPYADQGLLGGADVKELRPDVYRVKFQGNGYTSRESVQVYWLYRCAELAPEKGFSGFEILSDMQFVMQRPSPEEPARPVLSSTIASLRTRIPVSPDEAAEAAWRSQGSLASRSAEPVRMARGGGMVFFYGGGAAIPMPSIEGDVHFLTTPVESAPPRIFNAKALRDQLEPIVKADKCGVGNVCPHVHEYLLPKGKLR
jgi:hypothetical protein